MRPTYAKTLLTIICESTLEKPIIAQAQRFSLSGYTISEVRGAGQHGIRDGLWEADRTIEIKLIADEAHCQEMAAVLLDQFSQNYSVVMYLSPIAVFRKEKF
jgi:hypothetical protein